ncbi:MAG: hypothetical protein GY842_09000, partial [bacterium]|nr:hypothetical protein [bacterium]
MGRLVGLSSVYRWTMLLVVVAGLAIYAACDAPSSPERIEGPAVSGNRIPELTITTPAENIVLGQGANLTIRWSDQDRDSGAMISFALVNLNESASPATVLLVEGIPEDDDSADDAVTVSTAFVPRGAYHLRGTIGDGVNAPLSTFASTPAPASTRVVITIGEEGSTPGNRPPTIFVVEPMVNLSVTLDDTIEIVVQPTEDPFDVTTPFDADGTSRLFLSLDMDDDPNTGDPLSPDPDEIIPLLDEPEEIPEGTAGQLEPFQVSVDLSRFPAREDGKPYFIRVTITDDDNEPRDAYASGTISVTRPAAGLVDLDLVGGTLTGARWLGFDPGARLGAAMTSVGNFDFQAPAEDDPGDQVDDCMLVAQYGAPTGLGAIGEAYLVYGVAGQRFGGRINVNTVGKTVGGATFMGPVPRTGGSPETSGITSVGYVPDLTGDGRPELLFGCPFVDGVRTTRDDDTGDNSVPGSDEFVVEIRQGRITITNDRTDEVVSEFLTYDGVSDTYLDATSPTTPFGDEEHMFMDTGLLGEDVVPVRWALIKFEDLRSFVFDFALWDEDDYTLDSAVLEFESGLAGANSPTVNPLLHDFDPDFSTYDNWPFGGGDPVEDVDYDSDSADFEEDTTAGGGNKNTADVTTAF